MAADSASEPAGRRAPPRRGPTRSGQRTPNRSVPTQRDRRVAHPASRVRRSSGEHRVRGQRAGLLPERLDSAARWVLNFGHRWPASLGSSAPRPSAKRDPESHTRRRAPPRARRRRETPEPPSCALGGSAEPKNGPSSLFSGDTSARRWSRVDRGAGKRTGRVPGQPGGGSAAVSRAACPTWARPCVPVRACSRVLLPWRSSSIRPSGGPAASTALLKTQRKPADARRRLDDGRVPEVAVRFEAISPRGRVGHGASPSRAARRPWGVACGSTSRRRSGPRTGSGAAERRRGGRAPARRRARAARQRQHPAPDHPGGGASTLRASQRPTSRPTRRRASPGSRRRASAARRPPSRRRSAPAAGRAPRRRPRPTPSVGRRAPRRRGTRAPDQSPVTCTNPVGRVTARPMRDSPLNVIAFVAKFVPDSRANSTVACCRS